MTIRAHLLLLTFGTLFPFLVLCAATGWMAATGAAASTDELLSLIGVGAFAATALSVLLALALANTLANKRIAAPLASLLSLAKALSAGAPPELPARIPVREIADASRALAEAVKAAQAREAALHTADRAKNDFFAILSHELRNPLGALAAAAEVLEKLAPKDAAARQAIDVVVRQVEHMTRLVEDLLDISRITRGKLRLTCRPLSLAQAVERTVRDMEASGRLDKHAVGLELSPVWVRADEARIAQIVSNLLGNAVKYTPEGGQIVLSVQRAGDTALLSVCDSGIGMPPELAARVFEPFVQGERSLDREARGLGIGLTLVKHLAELHGGKASADSIGLGHGSTFTVSLPAIEAGADEAPHAAVGAVKRGRRRILLIEDNDDVRRTLGTALALHGHRVFEAADGRAGIQAVASVHPDVVVIDVGLPGLSGYQVAETLRAAPGGHNMVLMALSGYGQADSLRRAQDAGFDEDVTKPITPERLARLMDAALTAKARDAQS